MSDLYNRIEELCQKRGTNITAMCKESGAPRGSLTDLKMGRTERLNTTTLSKIGEFFGVSVDFLLGKEDTKKAPTPKSERDMENEEIIQRLEAADEATRTVVLRLLGLQ